MEKFINAVLLAGQKAQNALQSKDSALYKKHKMGAGGDISIGADLVSEAIFCEHLGVFGNIDSEERGFVDNKSESTIIIDPLDGSDNFLSNIPYYGASIALCENDEAKIGVVINFCDSSVVISDGKKNFYGNLNENFSDFKSYDILKDSADSIDSIDSTESADSKNSKDSQIPQISHISRPNAPKCGIFERAYSNPQICQKLKQNNIKFRSLGALALSLGISNDVNFVLFSGEIRKYDVAAGFLISSGLHKFVDKNFVLISKDKQLFDKITKLLV